MNVTRGRFLKLSVGTIGAAAVAEGGRIVDIEGNPDWAIRNLTWDGNKPLPSFANLKEDGSTACGAWIYTGVIPEEGKNNAACPNGYSEAGGLNVFYLLRDDPAVSGLPTMPMVPKRKQFGALLRALEAGRLPRGSRTAGITPDRESVCARVTSSRGPWPSRPSLRRSRQPCGTSP